MQNISEAERFEAMILQAGEAHGTNFIDNVKDHVSMELSRVDGTFSPGLYQLSGKIGDYFFYLREEDGHATLKVAIKANDVHLSPDWWASMELGDSPMPYSGIFIKLLEKIEPAEKLYYFPMQLRWDSGAGKYSEYGDGSFMIGPWYPQGSYIDDEGLEHALTLGCISSRGRNAEDALANLKKFEEDSYFTSLGWSVEKQESLHNDAIEAVEVGMNSWPGPLEWVEPTPDYVPSFLK